MDTKKLNTLIETSEKTSEKFKETVYWARYRQELIKEVSQMDINDLRSGKHPRFASFGFNEFFPKRSFVNKSKDVVKIIWKYLFSNKTYFANTLSPYGLTLEDIQQMAYHHCELQGNLTNSKPISSIESSKFGRPADSFEINGRTYTMAFLEYYIRYCFANQNIGFRGDEVIVELGSGSGHQVEVIKKIHPNATILCFDLPVPLFLCEQYLSNALGKENIVSFEETLNWQNLSGISKGKVHFFGNWQFPMLKDLKFDIFWNAASFGEMEPEIVQNYLSYVLGNSNWVYLLQVRHGKSIVRKKITFEDYDQWLKGYQLVKQHDAYQAHRKLLEESSYFEAVWKKS